MKLSILIAFAIVHVVRAANGQMLPPVPSFLTNEQPSTSPKFPTPDPGCHMWPPVPSILTNEEPRTIPGGPKPDPRCWDRITKSLPDSDPSAPKVPERDTPPWPPVLPVMPGNYKPMPLPLPLPREEGKIIHYGPSPILAGVTRQ